MRILILFLLLEGWKSSAGEDVVEKETPIFPDFIRTTRPFPPGMFLITVIFPGEDFSGVQDVLGLGVGMVEEETGEGVVEGELLT